MIEETATVTRIGSGRVWITSRQAGGCAGCMQQSSCGTATLSKLLPQRELSLTCELALQPGDQVRVAIDDSCLVWGSLLLYLLPILLTLLTVAWAELFLPALTDWLPELALSTLLLAFGCIHRFQAAWLPTGRFRLLIVGKC